MVMRGTTLSRGRKMKGCVIETIRQYLKECIEIIKEIEEREKRRMEIKKKGIRDIILYDGKYHFYEIEPGILKCDRYGEEWRDFTGDKAVSGLFDYVFELMEGKND